MILQVVVDGCAGLLVLIAQASWASGRWLIVACFDDDAPEPNQHEGAERGFQLAVFGSTMLQLAPVCVRSDRLQRKKTNAQRKTKNAACTARRTFTSGVSSSIVQDRRSLFLFF